MGILANNIACKYLLLTLLSVLKSSKCDLTSPSEAPFIAQVDEATSKQFGEDGVALFMEEHNGFIDPKSFITHYAIPSVPVVLRNSAKHFPAFELWKTDDYFRSLELSEEDSVVVETKKKENRSTKAVNMHFQDFVEVYNVSNQYMVNGLPDFLGDDVILPWSLQCRDIVEDGIVESIMWFSSGGTKSVVHTDSVDNINCVFSGNKSFVFVDPRKYWEEVPLDHPEGAYSGIDVDNVDYEKYPHLKDIEYYHVNISAGDCIFIPYRWIHQVRSYGRNIAVNIWWDYHSNRHINLDACEPEEDTMLTMNNVNFIGFDTIMNNPEQLRDQFREYARLPNGLTEEGLASYLIRDTGVDLQEVGSSFIIPIKNMIRALDVDLNRRVILNEVLVASDDVWETVSEEMERALNLLDNIIESMEQEREAEENTDEPALPRDEL